MQTPLCGLWCAAIANYPSTCRAHSTHITHITHSTHTMHSAPARRRGSRRSAGRAPAGNGRLQFKKAKSGEERVELPSSWRAELVRTKLSSPSAGTALGRPLQTSTHPAARVSKCRQPHHPLSPALQLASVLQKIMMRLPRRCSPSTTCKGVEYTGWQVC